MSLPDKYDALAGSIEDGSKEKYETQLKSYTDTLDSFWKFEIVPGFFKQSEDADQFTFNYLKEDFGRILSWQDTFAKLDELNANASENEAYKVFFLARHGQGYHNFANMKYGQKAWDEKWARLTTDGEIVWGPDPELTELGIAQAKDNAHVWGEQIQKGIRLPSKWYASPFTRSIDTLINTWQEHVDLKAVKPFIMEDFRETVGIHMCDKRSPRSVIAAKYEKLGFVIEDGFVEEDIYFKEDVRETLEEHSVRMNRSFQYIFNNAKDSVISITSHSETIRSQLMVLNHRPFSIGTGGMIPVFVKGTRVDN